MGEILAPGKDGRERKERKKVGDEGSNGFKLPFPLASSFHSLLNGSCGKNRKL
jgi:hypothetical protein